MRTAARQIASWALGLGIEDIPVEALEAGKRHIIDGLGCAFGALKAHQAPYAVEFARRFEGPQESSIFGIASQVPAPVAAFTNGVLIHALDFDDTHGEALVHPTSVVLPAALAVAEELDASGTQFLEACLAGYETVIRLGASVRHGFHARGLHATSVCGVFSAAVVASKLMGLSEDQTVHALGIAGSQAGGLLEFLDAGSSTKQLHPGFASQSGVVAARLASSGATGPDTVLEGSRGVFRSLAGVEVDPATLTDGLGSRWEVTRTTIKPYPACQLSHASIDALATVIGKVKAEDVESILFDLPAESVSIVCEPADQKSTPRTPYEGKFSLPYSAAAFLVDGRLDVQSFEEAELQRPDVLELARKVKYRSFDSSVPAAQAPGRAEVTLAGGDVISGEVSSSSGGPESPLTDEEVHRKFLSNGGPKESAKAIHRLETVPSIRELTAYWR